MKLEKKIRNIVLALYVGVLGACQVITPSEQFIPVDKDEIERIIFESERTSLLLDFSAWQCVNCPNAAQTAHDILNIFGDKLVVMEVHPESNSLTKPAPNGMCDYTCAAADSLYKALGGTSTTPLPTGSVNMKAQADGNYLMSYTQWGGKVLEAVVQTHPICYIDIENDFTAKQLSYTIENNTSEAINGKVFIWVTEDNLTTGQKFQDSTTINYKRNHLLRTSLIEAEGRNIEVKANRKWGEKVVYDLSDNIENTQNCHIVIAVYAKGEIVQAKEITLE